MLYVCTMKIFFSRVHRRYYNKNEPWSWNFYRKSEMFTSIPENIIPHASNTNKIVKNAAINYYHFSKFEVKKNLLYFSTYLVCLWTYCCLFVFLLVVWKKTPKLTHWLSDFIPKGLWLPKQTQNTLYLTDWRLGFRRNS